MGGLPSHPPLEKKEGEGAREKLHHIPTWRVRKSAPQQRLGQTGSHGQGLGGGEGDKIKFTL